MEEGVFIGLHRWHDCCLQKCLCHPWFPGTCPRLFNQVSLRISQRKYNCCIQLHTSLAPTRVARLRHGAKFFHDLEILTYNNKSLKNPEFHHKIRATNPRWAWAHEQSIYSLIAPFIQGALLKSRMSGVRPVRHTVMRFRYRIWWFRKWRGLGRDLKINNLQTSSKC